MESFLCQNLLQKFTCDLSEHVVVEISDIQTVLTVEESGGVPVATVSIKGKGRSITGKANSAAQEYQLEQKIEQRLTADLQETSNRLRREYGIDITNSYVSLGGQNRSLYRKYKDAPKDYNRQVQQVFQVDIELLNWE